MPTVIIDPNLSSRNGHHYTYDNALLDAFGEGIILANQAFDSGRDRAVVPTFSCTCYDQYSRDWDGDLQNFLKGNDNIYRELSCLSKTIFTSETTVIFPTVTENHLLGIISWCKSFPLGGCPNFIVFLMMPAGVNPNKTTKPEFESAAHYYRAAFRRAFDGGPPIEFFASSVEHSEHYSILAGRGIPFHPVIGAVQRHVPDKLDVPSNKCVLLYAGDAKENKGFLLLPSMVEKLCSKFPDEIFSIHANTANVFGEVKDAAELLGQLNDRFVNFHYVEKYVEPHEYQKLFSDSDIVCATYSSEVYRFKSSGVIWDAISSGKVVVTPKNTWGERELRRYEGGFVCYSNDTVAAQFRAISSAITRRRKLGLAAEIASEKFSLINSKSHLSLALERAVSRLNHVKLQLGGLINGRCLEHSFEGWHDLESYENKALRWTKHRFDLEFSTIEPGVIFFRIVGVQGKRAALSSVSAHLGGGVVPLQWNLSADGSWSVVGEVFVASVGTAAVVFNVGCPSPVEGDNRELGLLTTGSSVEMASSMARVDNEGDARIDLSFTSANPSSSGPEGGAQQVAVNRFSVARVEIPTHFDWVSVKVETGVSKIDISRISLYLDGDPLTLSETSRSPGAFEAPLITHDHVCRGRTVEFWLDLGDEKFNSLFPHKISASILGA